MTAKHQLSLMFISFILFTSQRETNGNGLTKGIQWMQAVNKNRTNTQSSLSSEEETLRKPSTPPRAMMDRLTTSFLTKPPDSTSPRILMKSNSTLGIFPTDQTPSLLDTSLTSGNSSQSGMFNFSFGVEEELGVGEVASVDLKEKIRVLSAVGIDNLLTLGDEEVTPETLQTVEELYPFPELIPDLADPITTVAVVKAVVQADPMFLAEVIEERDDDQAIADGMKVPYEAREVWDAKTPDRNDDGDVISIRGLAYAGLDGRPSTSLANIFILALSDQNATYGELFTPFIEEEPVVRSYLEAVFNDTSYLDKITKADANKIITKSYYTFGRRLQVDSGSPVKSFVCAHCYPKRPCKKCFWCNPKKRGK